MNISDEAIEAAYRANGAGGYVNKEDVRNILEAAAPHLMAAAWGEGADAGYKLALLEGPDSDYVAEPNPYRSAGAGE